MVFMNKVTFYHMMTYKSNKNVNRYIDDFLPESKLSI